MDQEEASSILGLADVHQEYDQQQQNEADDSDCIEFWQDST